jgi:hypothetical protein
MPPVPPPLSRHQLERILGLEHGTSNEEVARVSIRLLTRLEARREQAGGSEREALTLEIDALTSSLIFLAGWTRAGDSGGDEVETGARLTSAGVAVAKSKMARERLLFGMIALLGGVVIALFAAFLSRGGTTEKDTRVITEPAFLIVESRPKNAELRIRPPDTEELLLKISGDGARIELDPDRYQLEVSREDCPDTWVEEIDLEPGETRRYEPAICTGAGELVVRSNVAADRLRIDDLDLGAPRAAPHLLGVGDHVVRVDKEGFTAFEGKVRIRPDERIEIRAELVALKDGAGASDGGGTSQTGEAPLPFEVVAPSAPPSNADAKPVAGRPNATQPLLPEPIVPDPISADQLSLPKPELDFDPSTQFRRLAKGGSTTWHDAVTSRFLEGYDADGSGRIDRVAETQSIPCEFWEEVERSFDNGRLGLSMSRLYGFDGSEWHPKALGFAREQRGLAYERMRECGLAP